jgi:hypothetical protein
VAPFFLRRVVIWIALVLACALPLATLTWRQFTPAEKFAEGLGAVVWVVAVMWFAPVVWVFLIRAVSRPSAPC